MRKTKSKRGKMDQAMTDAALGPEPDFAPDHKLEKLEYLGALNWYAATLDRDTNKEYVLTFLKEQGRKDDFQKAKKLAPDWMTPTFGAISRMLTRNIKIPETGPVWLDKRLTELFQKYEDCPEVEDWSGAERGKFKPAAPKPNVQDRIAGRARYIASEIDCIFDDSVWENTEEIDAADKIFNLLHKENVSGQVAAMAADILQPHLDELKEIPNNKDLQEAYRVYTKDELRRFKAFYELAIQTCRQFNANVIRTRVRKPRAKKAKNPTKTLEAFRYLKAFNEWQLVSLDPSKIIGSDEVWLYLPKRRYLNVIRAMDRGGIGLKRQSFTNVDTKRSVRKKLGAKTAQKVVTALAVATKRQAQNILKETKGAERPVRLRTSEETLILAVFK